MAHSAKKNKCLLVHYSTDYVFSGDHKFPWKEQDITNPKSVYGQTKLNGEQAIIDSECEYMIFRTAWVFSNRRNNFLNTMLRLAETHQQLKIVNDQQGAPTWASSIALATMLALNIPETGLYHLTSNGSTTWFGFAQKIFSQAQRVGLIEQQPELIPISSKDFPTDAERPKYSVLNCRKFEGIFNVKLPHWQTTLQLCMQQRMKP
jgi:dTDP-4-dehydrorhamnose reductase